MNVKCLEIKNDFRYSCTYILYTEDSPIVWLIDCGDADKIISWIKKHQKTLGGIFLTHCHIDHIYGVNQMTEAYPNADIYLAKETGKTGVRDLRLNLTKYMEEPYVVETEILVEVDEGDEIKIFDDTFLKVYKTDGHSPDSMTYRVNNLLFTGDAYIPPLPVVTKLPGNNKPMAEQSKTRIIEMVDKESLTIMPGHYPHESNNEKL
jgi:glyoxylase-like metal-dependent hydrolase (beta-lactamase superfamily II)